MSRIQLQAGYLLGCLLEAVRESPEADFFASVLEGLCAFDVESEHAFEPTLDDPIFAVLDNLISRGRPTLPSCFIEARLAESLLLTTEVTENGTIQFPLRDPLDKMTLGLLKKALAPVDSRIAQASRRTETGDDGMSLDSPGEHTFYYHLLTEVAPAFISQLIELQRPIKTIVAKHEEPALYRQRVDFSVELPRAPHHKKGLVIEVDGRQHHELASQRHLDHLRDQVLTRSDWAPTLRIPAGEVRQRASELATRLDLFVEHPYGRLLDDQYRNPMWRDKTERRWLQAVLTPLGIARIQKTLVRLVLSGALDPSSEVWRIVIVERDVPCAALALADFTHLLNNLYALEGNGRSCPRLEVQIYRTPEFVDCDLARYDRVHLLTAPPIPMDADVVLDIALLQRSGYSELPPAFLRTQGTRAAHVRLRTAYSSRTANRLTGGRPIAYESKANEGALAFFLRNLFRKQTFREKQTDIIHEALQGRSVVGLLPTGAGKSLTYQMPALLQPGCTIVVAPLKSLMRDQDSNLRRIGIDTTVFINGDLDTNTRNAAQLNMRNGHYQFVFVSPERFLITEFRENVRQLQIPPAFCVVDEAHCVSEWGHDFRTSYLRLGVNVRKTCQSLWPKLPVLALTGTASFDVLADIRRELQLGDDDMMVTPASLERDELSFMIVSVPRPEVPKDANAWTIKSAVLESKAVAARDLLRRLPAAPPMRSGGDTADNAGSFALNGSRTKSGIVFTPHANGDVIGVRALAARISEAVPVLLVCHRGVAG